MNIVTQADINYIPGLKIMLFSLRYNNPSIDIDLYLLDNNFDKYDGLDSLLDKLKIVKHTIFVPDEYIAFIKATIKNKETLEHFGFLSCFRLFLPYLSDLNKALYLDADIVINGDITKLYNFNLGNNYLAAVVDPSRSEELGYTYFNSGVMLINIEALRNNISLESMKQIMENYSNNFSFDNDIINDIAKGHIYYISSKYNVLLSLDSFLNQYYADVKDNVIIYHFTCNKPWLYYNLDVDTEKLRIWLSYNSLYLAEI